MKKLLIFLAFVPLVSFGQFSKGTKMIGGNISFSSSKYNSEPNLPSYNNYFSGNSHLGFFLNESFAIGPAINFTNIKTPFFNPTTNSIGYRNTNSYGGGVFVRKFLPISEKFYFSLQGEGLVGRTKGEDDPENDTTLRLSIQPMFTFMPNKNWGFDIGVSQLYFRSNWSDSQLRERHFQASLGQVSLGVNYFFGRN
ncbi:hypothetical protein ACFSKL_12450 [Belliella marina]|uniref:Outer membrane protein beta-barrel domain-containing protein n=1 Tax=Belliella marina TaxID=1644146 RepID=A0ABW4VPX1_9BACT